jgi:hypothetical protein
MFSYILNVSAGGVPSIAACCIGRGLRVKRASGVISREAGTAVCSRPNKIKEIILIRYPAEDRARTAKVNRNIQKSFSCVT